MPTKSRRDVAQNSETAATADNDSTAKKPLASFKNGPVQAGVFRDILSEQDDQRVTYSVTLSKRYKDRAGQWQTSRSLFPADMANAIRCLTRALEYLEGLENN